MFAGIGGSVCTLAYTDEALAWERNAPGAQTADSRQRERVLSGALIAASIGWHQQRVQSRAAEATSTAFVPPNANEFESA